MQYREHSLSARRGFGFALLFLAGVLGGCKLEVVGTPGGVVSVSVPPTETCSAPAGGVCGQYDNKTEVEVIAQADAGHEFVGWSGDCSGLGFCRVTLDANRNVTANFAPAADLVLHDTDTDLVTVLENGLLQGSCDRWRADPANASPWLEKMCGKWMFFYEGFNITGVPGPIAEFMVRYLPDTVGKGFEHFGMIADPFSPQGLPLGLSEGASIGGVKTLSFTCASCHFAQAEDGRYSAGMANHDYDYGKQITALNYVVAAIMPASMQEKTASRATLEWLQPVFDEIDARGLEGKLFLAMTKMTGILLSGASLPDVSEETQAQYLQWKPGTQDFVINPVGAEDNVHTVSKILPLWNLHDAAHMQAAGGAHAMLGFTGDTPDLLTFAKGFVNLSQGDYPEEHLQPLVTYLLSLKTPASVLEQDPVLVERGRQLFGSEGCNACHDGPNHASTRRFDYAEIGTDAALMRWADADLDGVSDVPSVISLPLGNVLKAPRLTGLWAQKRFLHNGSVDSLEALLCLNHERPTRTDEPFGDQGHMYGCDSMEATDKQAMLAYLRSL